MLLNFTNVTVLFCSLQVTHLLLHQLFSLILQHHRAFQTRRRLIPWQRRSQLRQRWPKPRRDICYNQRIFKMSRRRRKQLQHMYRRHYQQKLQQRFYWQNWRHKNPQRRHQNLSLERKVFVIFCVHNNLEVMHVIAVNQVYLDRHTELLNSDHLGTRCLFNIKFNSKLFPSSIFFFLSLTFSSM